MPEDNDKKNEKLFRTAPELQALATEEPEMEAQAPKEFNASKSTLKLTGSWESLHPDELVTPKIFTSSHIAIESAEKDDGSYEAEETTEGDELIGTTIADRYEIVDIIGHGGMSVVYKARQIGSDRIVAMKRIRVNSAEDIMRFSREIRSHSRLRHKNIVEYMEFVATSAGEFFLVMERVKGLSLLDIMCSVGRIESAENVASIMIQACDALAFAHKNGVIHRDLKSSNIILVREDDSDELIVKILDFGIARMEGEGRITFTGRAVGSPVYMSPEQCRAKTMTVCSDIYSISVVAYEIITGEAPYSEGSIRDIMAAHCNPNKQPRPIVELVPEMPGGQMLDQIIQKSMQTDPAKRWQTATQLKEAFEFWIQAVQNGEEHISLPPEMLEAEAMEEIPQEVYSLSSTERDELRAFARSRSSSMQTSFASGASVDSGVHRADSINRQKSEFYETQSLRAQQADLQLSIEEVKKHALVLAVLLGIVLISLGIYATVDANKLAHIIRNDQSAEPVAPAETENNSADRAVQPSDLDADAAAQHPSKTAEPEEESSSADSTQHAAGKAAGKSLSRNSSRKAH